MPTTEANHEPIMQSAFAFWNAKTLLTAIEFDLFTQLGDQKMTGPELGKELGIHPRGIYDFFDALVAMKFLERDGEGPESRYFNNTSGKTFLVRKAYDALPEGGAFIAIESLIDDARRENVFGLLMSLNMLIETGSGFDYTGADFQGWCREVGFKRFEVLHLAGPASAAIAYK